jgi:protein-tyrosine kinase
MSLIEQAAKRLEELKKTGVEVPDALEDTPQQPAASSRQPTPELLAARLAELDREDAGAHAPDSELPQTESPHTMGGPAPRRVHIDLSRLASIGLVTPEAPHSPIANEFRVVKRPILANTQGAHGAAAVKNGNLIMITSALPGEGKSFSALNLAMSIAMEQDSTVLLIDADVANPTLLKLMGLPPTKGLMDVLTEPGTQLGDVLLRTNVPKLTLLPAGTPHQRATELLASGAMVKMVSEMASRYKDRVLIFDSPPLLPTTESRVLATHMGQIVVVVEAESTTHGSLKSALAHLESCPIVMAMLNKAPRSEVGQYYGYYGYARATQT